VTALRIIVAVAVLVDCATAVITGRAVSKRRLTYRTGYLVLLAVVVTSYVVVLVATLKAHR